MKYLIVIPARYASTRFPGKPLAILGGKPVIQRVYEQARQLTSDIYVATDDSRIYDTVTSFGGNAVMTSPDHKSGTDRIEEAVRKIQEKTHAEYDVIVNIQGDEPFIQPAQIKALIDCFDDERTEIATLGIRFGRPGEAECDNTALLHDIQNSNSPKIAVSQQGFALYFSRSVIPFCRGVEEARWPETFPYIKHIGMYAYRRHVLGEVTALPQSPLEKAESLEQLRWLENGYRIKVGITTSETIGIDTPEDLEKAERFLEEIVRL